jgi:hypothetical protein
MPEWLKARLATGLFLWLLIGIGWGVWTALKWVVSWFQ